MEAVKGDWLSALSSAETRSMMMPTSAARSGDEPFEQPAVLAQVPVDQKMPLNALAGLLPKPPCPVLVRQDLPHEPAEGRQVARVVQQQAARAILNLVQHAADGAGDHRAGLPHR